MTAEILHEGPDHIPDLIELALSQDAARRIVRGQLQASESNLVVIGREGALFQQDFRRFQSFVRIAREHALIEVFRRRESGSVAQEDVEELKPLHMSPQHHEAERQGRGDKQAHGPPEPGPEDRGDDDGEGREPRALSVDDRLDHMPHERLADQEQRQGHESHGPAGIDRGGEQDRRDGCNEGADIGHEAHQGYEHAPQDGARHPDQP